MGYSTDFSGKFMITPPLSGDLREYLKAFSETRRMKRDPDKAGRLPDPRREAVGLPIGHDGEYFVGGTGYKGQEEDESVLDGNSPPGAPGHSPGKPFDLAAEDKARAEGQQPGLWCQWTPTEDGAGLVWDETEKFYYYKEWLEYLIVRFFLPYGYTLNGTIEWQGEDPGDVGQLTLHDNMLAVNYGPA